MKSVIIEAIFQTVLEYLAIPMALAILFAAAIGNELTLPLFAAFVFVRAALEYLIRVVASVWYEEKKNRSR